MLKTMRKANIKGFSLIELMVVVAIIGILAAVAVPNFQRFQRKARQSEAKALLGGIATAAEVFRSEWESYYGDFTNLGYAPTGVLKYNAGFTGTGAAPLLPNGMANPSFTAGSGETDTDQACAMFAAAECTGAGVALPGASMAGAPAVAAFSAGAEGIIGGTMNDAWSINQLKVLTNDQNGTL